MKHESEAKESECEELERHNESVAIAFCRGGESLIEPEEPFGDPLWGGRCRQFKPCSSTGSVERARGASGRSGGEAIGEKQCDEPKCEVLLPSSIAQGQATKRSPDLL